MTTATTRRAITLLLVVTVIMVGALSSSQERALSQSAGSTSTAYATDEILVKPEAAASESSLDQIEGLNGTGREEALPLVDALVVDLPDGLSVQESIARYEASPSVEFAEPNYEVFADQSASEYPSPNDPDFTFQWALDNTGQEGGAQDADIDAPEAWDMTTGNPDSVVAVIDEGVDINHPDLENNVWTNPGEVPGNGTDDDGNGYVDDVHGWDFSRSNPSNPGDATVYDANDGEDHGTHVAGILAAEGNNNEGIAGVNWNAKMMPVKFLIGGRGKVDNAIKALDYAVAEGAKISNNSWGCNGGGSGCQSQLLYEAISRANDRGHLFIASAGNASNGASSGADTDVIEHYPSGYELPNIISVGATDDQDVLWQDSNYGSSTVDLVAPGVNIWSTVPGYYDYLSGTSMAAPHVTGAAALVKSQSPGLSNLQIKESILQSVDQKASLQGKTVTGGRVNAAGALTVNTPAPSDTEAPTVSSVAPMADSEGILPATNVEAVFSEGMDAATLTDAFTLTKEGATDPLTAQVSYDAASKQAVLDPSADIDYGATYNATIKGGANGAKDLAGNPLAANKVWRFTTASASDTTAPSVNAPKESMAFPFGQIDTRTVPIAIEWSGTDESSGIAAYELQKSIDGGAFATVDLRTPTSVRDVQSLVPSFRYQFRVRAKDAAGNWSDWALAPSFIYRDYQEGHSSIDYRPAALWSRQAVDGAYGGSVMHENEAGSSATFTFTGSEIAWVTSLGTNRGIATIWLDGERMTTVDLHHRYFSVPRAVRFHKTWASSGTHKVKVEVRGTKHYMSDGTRVDLDAFITHP